MAGLPKSYIKKYGITKKAWRMYRSSKKKTKSKSKTRKTSNKKGGKRKLARKGFNTAKIFSLLRTASLLAPVASRLIGPGNMQQKLGWTLEDFTGYSISNQTFKFDRLKRGWLPYLATSVVTHGIPKLTSLIRKLF